jgi:tetratricopeptide (TPR) repeat protein
MIHATKPVFITLAFSLLVSFPHQASAAAKRPAARSGGGGVYLSTPNPTNPLEHNNRAVELGSKGLWPDAIREHELAVTGDPNNKEFRTNLSAAQLRYGDILAGRKDNYNAMKQYRGALYVDPNNGVADEHLDECLKRIGKDPTSFKVRSGIAEDADSSGDYETAIVEYRKTVKMSDSGPNHANLGRVLLKAGKVVDGYSELKIAAGKTWEERDQKELGACHRQLGDILKEFAYIAKNDGRGTVGMKRLLNAGIEYRRAVTLNSADLDAVRSLIEVARDAVAISPSFDNHLTLAGAYQLAGDFDHAKMEYESCYKLNPNSTVLPAARKSFYLSVVKSPLASPAMLASTMQKVDASLQKNPADPELLYLYGRGKEAQGDKEAALTAYKKAAEINAYVNPDLQQGISRLSGGPVEAPTTKTAIAAPKESKEREDKTKNLLQYADIEKKLVAGDIDNAQQQLLELVQKDPQNGRAWLLLGNTHEKKSDLDQAIVAYRQASLLKEKDADSALRQINTARVQPMMKEADQAIGEKNWVKASSSLREALSIGPELPFVHRKMAEVLKQLGDNKEADKELKKAAELEK